MLGFGRWGVEANGLSDYDKYKDNVLKFNCWRWGEGWMKNVLGVKYQKITSSGDVYFGLDSKIPKIFSCKVFSNKSTHFKPQSLSYRNQPIDFYYK